MVSATCAPGRSAWQTGVWQLRSRRMLLCGTTWVSRATLSLPLQQIGRSPPQWYPACTHLRQPRKKSQGGRGQRNPTPHRSGILREPDR
eukprot:464277-Prorocentrum_minimum.AAC.1